MALPFARSATVAFSRPRPTAVNAVASSSRYMSTTAPRLAGPPARASSEEAGSALPVPLTNLKFLSFPEFKALKPPHGVHVATLHLQSYHPYNLDLTAQFAVHSAASLNIPTSLPAFLPREKSLYTVLKSPFVKKKAQENFERRTHKRAIKVYDATPEGVDLWLRYLRQNGLPGVGMKAYVHEYVELGFGKSEGGAAEQTADEKKISDAAEELVKVLSESEQGSTGATSKEGESEAIPEKEVKQK